MDTLFDIYKKQEIDKTLEEIENMITGGIHKSVILKKFSKTKMFEEFLDIANARIRFKEKGIDKRLYLNSNDLRFSTPKIVADYRAERLKCKIIADLGSGVGMQSFSFAKKCKKVYAVEIDKRKVRYAEENAKILGINNIEFICGDILDEKIIKKIKEAEIFFCDPERLPSETERQLETILPNPKVLIEEYPKNIVIEFPPQIKRNDFDCEKEYLSVNGKLNRLDLYFGDLKKANYSAVTLPSEERIEGEKQEKADFSKKGIHPNEFIYEIDPAIIKAGLEFALLKKTGALLDSSLLAFSKKEIKSNFFKNSFRVLEVCDSGFDCIIKALQKHRAGNIVLRQKIDPQLYWKTRTSYESKLTGEKTVHLFIFDKAIIAEKI